MKAVNYYVKSPYWGWDRAGKRVRKRIKRNMKAGSLTILSSGSYFVVAKKGKHTYAIVDSRSFNRFVEEMRSERSK
jgi:hypothetical protein